MKRQAKDYSLARGTGFTFIEVIIVLLILGIVAMIGLPRLNAMLEDSRLSGAAGEIVTALEFAQLSSMTSGGQTRVTIEAAADTILVEQFRPSVDLLGGESELSETDVEGGAFAPMELPMNPGIEYSISLPNEERFNDVDIASVAFGAGNYVTFDVLGAPSSGGTVTLTCGGRQMAVNVDALTGKVTVSE